jgi:CheY-like chemotaxis protein
VVEDEDASANALQDALSHANCDVEMVGSAEDALEALRDRFFSLAIVDVGLPGMDGCSLLERMAQDPNWARIPAIIVSGHVAALPHGAVAFLRKPINAPDLVELVQRHARK